MRLKKRAVIYRRPAVTAGYDAVCSATIDPKGRAAAEQSQSAFVSR